MKENETYTLKDWTVHPELNLLKNQESELLLKPRLMRLFDYFLQHPNTIITKDKLLEEVWKNRIVTDNLLTKSISELRKLLHKHFSDTLEIETLRNVGYRLNINRTRPIVEEKPQYVIQKKTKVLLQKHRLPAWPAYLLLLGLGIIALLAFGIWSQHENKTYDFKHHKITSLKGLEMNPAISPDGKNIAFNWREESQVTSQIYVQSLQSSTPRKLSDNNLLEFSPIWSLDGQYVLFFRRVAAGKFQLLKKSVIGMEEVVLTQLDFFGIDDLLWTKDGSRLLFMGRKEETTSRALYCFDIGNASVTQLTYPPKGIYGDIYPSHTAIEEKISFIRAAYGESVFSNAAPTKGQIMVLDLKTKKLVELAEIHQEINSFLYLPSLRQYLCWVTEQLGEYTILAFDEKGQQSVLGKTGLGMPRNANLLGEDKICYEYWKSNVDINTYKLSSATEKVGKAQTYLNSTSWDWGLSFAARTNNVAFFSQRSGYTEIWMTDKDKPNNARQITDLESPLLKSLALSPDGKYIVFNSIKNNQSDLFLINSTGKGLKQLTYSLFEYAAPEWSTDGQSIYYASTETGDWQLYEYHLKTEKTVQLTTKGGYRALPSPKNTKILYFVKYHEDGLWSYHQDTKKTKWVAALNEVNHSTNWVITDTGIYYLTWRKSVAYVDYYDFDTQSNKNVMMLENMLVGLPALALSPDFETLYIAEGMGLNSDILALEFIEK